MYILSQILIVFSDIMCILSMLSNKKKNIVYYLLVSTVLFGLHYVCLSAWTGAAIALIELVFLIIMYVLEIKNLTKYNTYLSVVTIVFTILASILTWSGAISLIPMTAMVIYLITMSFKNVIIVKSGTFIRLILNGIYMLIFHSYFGATLTIAILIATIIGVVKDIKKSKQSNL